MIPLNLILSNVDIMGNLPKLLVGACAIILLLAFFVGFAKGFRQVSWCWLPCLAGFVGFIFVMGALKGKLPVQMPTIPGMSEAALTAMLIAFGCLLLAMVLYGFFSAVFRPKAVWVKKSRKEFKKEQKSGQGDGNPEKLVWKNCAPPTFYGRFWGAILCMVNTAVLLALVLACGLLLVNGVGSLKVKFADVLNIKIVNIALQYASKYALDFLTLCIPFFIACYGYKRGLVNSLRSIIKTAGGGLVILLAFGLPFMADTLQGDMGLITKLVARCTVLVAKLPAFLQPITAKLLAGILLLILFGVILAFVNYLMDKYYDMIKNAKLMGAIDSIVSCLIYFVIGVMVCIGVWAVLYAMDACGILKISEILSEETLLAKELFGFVKVFMDPLLTPFLVG